MQNNIEQTETNLWTHFEWNSFGSFALRFESMCEIILYFHGVKTAKFSICAYGMHSYRHYINEFVSLAMDGIYFLSL
jgi:hypothetical protein